MTENYASAVAAIESADLSAPIYRTARRLLDLAADHDGYLEITPTALSEIGGGGAEGTMRTHLIQLACWGFNPHPTRRPGATPTPSSNYADRASFNPHPTRRPGAT